MSLWSRIANVFRGDRLNREIDEELESHIGEAIEQGRDPPKPGERSDPRCGNARRAATSGWSHGSIRCAATRWRLIQLMLVESAWLADAARRVSAEAGNVPSVPPFPNRPGCDAARREIAATGQTGDRHEVSQKRRNSSQSPFCGLWLGRALGALRHLGHRDLRRGASSSSGATSSTWVASAQAWPNGSVSWP